MVLAQMVSHGQGIAVQQMAIAIGASLAASVVVYVMYHLFYGSRTIGAGVDRSFIIGGPAITALFLGIQSSIPLSLGLLGALSFVRFRTPVKDSAEIGFLLLLIASSIGIATGTYAIVIVLFVVVLAALCVQWFVRNRFSLRRPANIMVSMDKDAYYDRRQDLDGLFRGSFDNLCVRTMSVADGRVSLHYQFRHKGGFDQSDFIRRLNDLAGPGRVEIFSEAM